MSMVCRDTTSSPQPALCMPAPFLRQNVKPVHFSVGPFSACRQTCRLSVAVSVRQSDSTKSVSSKTTLPNRSTVCFSVCLFKLSVHLVVPHMQASPSLPFSSCLSVFLSCSPLNNLVVNLSESPSAPIVCQQAVHLPLLSA